MADGLPSNNTRRIVEDQLGNLWIGTANGLAQLQGDSFKTFGVAAGLRDRFIMSLYVDRDNTLWVGTNGGGLYKYNGDRFSRALSREADNDIVFNIVEDKEDGYWLSTNRGAIYFNETIGIYHATRAWFDK